MFATDIALYRIGDAYGIEYWRFLLPSEGVNFCHDLGYAEIQFISEENMLHFKSFIAMLLAFPVPIFADFSNDVAHVVDECLSCIHLDARHGALRVFAETNHLTDDEMARRLLFIADPANGFTNCFGTPLTRAAIGGIIEFPNAVNALPALEHYISIPETRMEALCTFGRITKHNDHFFTVTQNAVENNSLDRVFYLCYIRSVVNSDQLGLAVLDDLTRCKMESILIRGANFSFEGIIDFDDFLSHLLSGYTNSIEHVMAQQRINEYLIQRKKHILVYSVYRFVGDNSKLSDEEWYRRATNACQTEIARVMALPENERLNMTAILDAKIAAIEAAEARIARRELWKRRLRIGALVLPIPVIAIAVIFARRRMNR